MSGESISSRAATLILGALIATGLSITLVDLLTSVFGIDRKSRGARLIEIGLPVVGTILRPG